MSFGRAFFALRAISIAAGGFAKAQGNLADLNFQYDVNRAELIKPVFDLQDSYQSQLEKLREKVKGSGSLEKTTRRRWRHSREHSHRKTSSRKRRK